MPQRRPIDDTEPLDTISADAILYDHAHGLHDDHTDDVTGCTWPRCADAYETTERRWERIER